ncbi:glycine cleavage system protein H [Aerococcus urinaeequi]|uniref:Glycine cleavage system protein H n=1 Tax=Aerococcus viridans TaxID=1377 RepID=A0A2N6UBF1_9LACT|nr:MULTISPECIES: glycine cleavage system protein H [Aerococcus]OFU52417.1 glycine cleavage system protein H [Aerococcus sp. HMSC10H05]PMC78944.1 glycine cleavage system protein H [Aerococcus viridans]
MHKVYSKEGLYLEELENGAIRIGLSAYGSNAVGDVSYFAFFDDHELIEGKPFFSVEGSKAVTDMLAPISGKILSKNSLLVDEPDILNDSDEGRKWLVIVNSDQNIHWNSFLLEDQPIKN